MKKIGILGGTRFIGFHTALALQKAGHSVTIFNRGVSRPPEPLPSEINIVNGDRNILSDLRPFFRHDFDALIDISGYTHKQVSLITNNFRSKIGHYIFCSTSSAYELPTPVPHDENAKRTFLNKTYGGEKALAEDLLIDEWKHSQLPITVFRPQAVFGAHDPAHAGLIFSRLLNSQPIAISKDRYRYRINMLFIGDWVTAVSKSVQNELAYGKAYNLADDTVISQLDLIKLCAKIAARMPEISILDQPTHCGFHVGIPWLPYDLIAQNNEVKADLKMIFHPLEDALAKTLEWLKQHPKRLRIPSPRGEYFAVKHIPIPIGMPTYWKLKDTTKSYLSKLKNRILR